MLEDFESTIVIIIIIFLILSSICALLHYRKKAKLRTPHYTTNVITSQTRPLIFYHVPLSSIEEAPPPPYDLVVGNY